MSAAVASTVVVFGIPQCDSVKRARRWLTAQGIEHRFHDFKKLGVPSEALSAWVREVGWDRLVNRQGTTWRQLGEAEKARLAQPGDDAFELLSAHASVIKRPVIEWPGGQLTVGADETLLAAAAAAVTNLP